jgi:hypothetical protein
MKFNILIAALLAFAAGDAQARPAKRHHRVVVYHQPLQVVVRVRRPAVPAYWVKPALPLK